MGLIESESGGTGKPVRVNVLVVGGGQGSRAGGVLPKQFVRLNGVPMFVHAARPFFSFDSVLGVYPVLPANWADYCREDDLRSWLPGVGSIAPGGATRWESVLGALRILDRSVNIFNADYIVLHDAARPFLSLELVERVLLAGVRAGDDSRRGRPVCVTSVLASSDTLYQLDLEGVAGLLSAGLAEGMVTPLPRRYYWRAQTPQLFSSSFLRSVVEEWSSAVGRGESWPVGPHYTDEVSLFAQRCPEEKIILVHGDERNFKVTTRYDLELAGLLAPRLLADPGDLIS